jgi:hydroxyacylglutathione hydrolase
MLEIIALSVLTDNYIYLLHDKVSGKTAVVDPAEADPVLNILDKNNWRLDAIFNTHHHGDHIGGNLKLKQVTGCKIYAAKADKQRIPGIDILLQDADSLQLGTFQFLIMETPGHTSAHICFYSAKAQALFCGDTLFSLGCGRLFEGSAEQMWLSLQKLKALPTDTRIYCAHEYTMANGRFALSLEGENPELLKRMQEVAALRGQNQPTLPSTIGQELATNPFLREDSMAIRNSVGVGMNAASAQVFATIRRLKDEFH